ncbi:MAG: hypothetical protein GX146_00600 [Myxococcales bacterium]|jgi:Tfp pilus assembly protein PilX|nr:hypothetical protein [Myxococcales bacterium]
MKQLQTTTRKHQPEQRGFALIIVVMLVMMFTGLGLLAMRHARQEMRTKGAYFDFSQAALLVESALAMAAADLRISSDYYEMEFSFGGNAMDSAPENVDIWTTRYAIPLNQENFAEAASVVDSVCGSAPTDGCVPLLSSPFGGEQQFGAEFYTTVTYDAPVVGPCPPGYSCFEEQNYGWYIFGVRATARYGPPSQYLSHKFVEAGRASGYGQFTIGPIGAYGK